MIGTEARFEDVVMGSRFEEKVDCKGRDKEDEEG